MWSCQFLLTRVHLLHLARAASALVLCCQATTAVHSLQCCRVEVISALLLLGKVGVHSRVCQCAIFLGDSVCVAGQGRLVCPACRRCACVLSSVWSHADKMIHPCQRDALVTISSYNLVRVVSTRHVLHSTTCHHETWCAHKQLVITLFHTTDVDWGSRARAPCKRLRVVHHAKDPVTARCPTDACTRLCTTLIS